MESVPLLSSQDGSGWDQLEGFGPSRNRKVVGSNPTLVLHFRRSKAIKQDEHMLEITRALSH